MMYSQISSRFCLTVFVISLINLSFSECSVRKKRYVSFPEGSTFTFAFCMTLKAMTYGDIDIFSEAVAVAVNYDLPSNASQLPFAMLPNSAAMLPNGAQRLPNGAQRLPNGEAMLPNGAANIPPTLQAPVHHYYQNVYHRYRSARAERALIYQKAETVLDRIGMDGRSCVMRSLCEAVQLLPDKQSLIHKIIALIFTLPIDVMSRDEPTAVWKYRAAQLSGHHLENCEQLFPRCPISLLALALSLRPGHS